MKLTTIVDGKKKTLNVSFWSYFKFWILSYLVLTLIGLILVKIFL